MLILNVLVLKIHGWRQFIWRQENCWAEYMIPQYVQGEKLVAVLMSMLYQILLLQFLRDQLIC